MFAVNTDGSGFTNLHTFAGYPSDGASPTAGLILSGSTLYGTASAGGSSRNGTVFAVNVNGTAFTNLYSFTALSATTYQVGTNTNQGRINRVLRVRTRNSRILPHKDMVLFSTSATSPVFSKPTPAAILRLRMNYFR